MLTGKQWVGVTSFGVAAFTGGGALGYILAKRKYQVEPEVRYVFRVKGDAEVPNLLSFDAAEAQLVNEDRRERLEDAAPVETVERAVFSSEDPNWDYEVERNTRENKQIYTIHVDEYKNDEMGYRQTTLTYYKGDDVLVDELDTPIYNYPLFIGDSMEFGRGTSDPNAFYVRNEKEKTEYEILLDEGHYSVVVLGLEIEHEYEAQDLKHSRYPTRRFQMD